MDKKRQNIIDNVEYYSPLELAQQIQDGVITYEDLIKEAGDRLSLERRKELSQLLENRDKEAWSRTQEEGTIEAYQRYLDEFPTGVYRDEARTFKYALEEEEEEKRGTEEQERSWSDVDKRSKESLEAFIRSYPESKYVPEARKIINDLDLTAIQDIGIAGLLDKIKDAQLSVNISRDNKVEIIADTIKDYTSESADNRVEFLNAFSCDLNLIDSRVVKRLLDDGHLSAQDLLDIGVRPEYIRLVGKSENLQSFSANRAIESISKKCTEVYIWGIPSSGKSTALSAILSVANNGRIARTLSPDPTCQGYDYMMRLMNVFRENEVSSLLASTAVDDFYEMGFDLTDQKGRVHPITLIDMAGELMLCMHKKITGESLTEGETKTLVTLHRVLVDQRSANRKMHIFVIEYGAERVKHYGLPQEAYLQSANAYLKQTGVFKNDTDSVFIMITKADKAKDKTSEHFKDYLTKNYFGFINGLDDLCKTNSIGGGRAERIAFSLGEVCFQNFCRFNSQASENIVRILLERTPGIKTHKWARFVGGFGR